MDIPLVNPARVFRESTRIWHKLGGKINSCEMKVDIEWNMLSFMPCMFYLKY